jgi:hypothetical protein
METGKNLRKGMYIAQIVSWCSTNTLYTRPDVDGQKYKWVQQAHYPTTKKVLLKSRVQIPKNRSTGIFPLTRIPTGFTLTSRSQFTLIRLTTVTVRSRFTPIRPMAGSAVCPDRPESVHRDSSHGCFSRIFVPRLSLILNTPPQA